MASKQTSIKKFESLISAKRGLEFRKMFGCPCYFFNGKMMIGLYENSLFIRVGAKKLEKLIESPHYSAFKAKNKTMKEYVQIPIKTLTSNEFEGLYKASRRYLSSRGKK
jgi:TfoX/Sxy family transcriptional regulator of competence genes